MPEPTAPVTVETTPSAPVRATTAKAEPTPNAPPVQSMDDVYGEFDQLETKQPAPKKESAQPTRPTEKQDTSKTAAASADNSQTEDTKSAKDAATDGTKTQPDTKPVPINKLRDAYDMLKREHQTLKGEVEKLRKSNGDSERVKQLQEMLDAERKTREELQNELKFTSYEKSDEFKERYQKPYMDAYKMGRQKASSLKTTNDLGEVRQGTEADFDTIMRIDDDDSAAEKAVELFGNKAQMVLYYRERVQELHNASRSAIEDYRTKAGTRDKELAEARTRQEAEQSERARAAAETFRKAVEDGKAKRSELFTPAEGDQEAADVIKRGEAVADSLFSGINPKTGRPYTPDGLIRFHAFARNAIAAHGHLMHQLTAAKTRLTELESDLAEYKKSGSSEDSGRSEKPATGDGLPGDDEFDEADRRSTRRW